MAAKTVDEQLQMLVSLPDIVWPVLVLGPEGIMVPRAMPRPQDHGRSSLE